MEAVKGRIQNGVEQFLGSRYQLEIETIKTYRFTGVLLRGVSLESQVEGKKVPVWNLDRLTARFGLFSILFGRPRLKFDARAGEADISGSVQRQEGAWQIHGSLSDLDVGNVPWVKNLTGLKLESSIEGDWQIFYNPAEPLRTTGRLDIALDKLLLKASEVHLGEMGKFPLPDLQMADSKSVIEAQIDKGAIGLSNFLLQGKDIYLALEGKIFLANEPSNYRMNLKGKFKFSDKLWKTLDPILPEPWASELKKQKGPEDAYPLSISGPFSSPVIYSGSVKIFPFQPF